MFSAEGKSWFMGVAPPLPPSAFRREECDAWMESYPKLLEQYYDIVRKLIGVDGGGGVFGSHVLGDVVPTSSLLLGDVEGLYGSSRSACGSGVAGSKEHGERTGGCSVNSENDESREIVGAIGMGDVERVPRDDSVLDVEWTEARCVDVSGRPRSERLEDVVESVKSCEVDGRADNGERWVPFSSKLSTLGDATKVRGPNWARNHRNRLNKRAKGRKPGNVVPTTCELSSDDKGVPVGDSRVVKASLEERWVAENKLAVERAKRRLAVLQASDVAEEVKRYTTALRAGIERNMVSIEKTHATLVATGNVPDVFHGSAQTEVDSVPGLSDGVKSGTISPNSSVSEAEIRAMQQSILDMELKLARYRQITGLSWEAVEKADKKVWTDNTENHAVLEELYPMGYGIDTVGFPEGKFRAT